MDSLNNDCIDHILDYCDLRSKVNFALASKEYSEHFMRWAKRRLKVVNKSHLRGLTMREMICLMRFAGQFIEKVEINSEYLKEIVEFCTNLKHLHLSFDYVRSFEIQIPYLAKLTTLESFHYEVEGLWNETLEKVIKALAELPNLKKLCLNAEGYEGKYLKDLKHIETLELTNFNSLKKEHFQEFCATSKTLRTLYFGKEFNLLISIDKCIYEAMAQCQSLENVCLLNILQPHEDHTNIPNIKGFYMAMKLEGSWPFILRNLISTLNHRQLEALFLHSLHLRTQEAAAIGAKTNLKQLFCSFYEPKLLDHMTKLKDLEYFECHCIELSDDDILKVITTYPKLLYFGTNSPLLTNKFVHKLIQFLKNDDSKKRAGRLYIGVHPSVLKEIENTIYEGEFINYFNIIDVSLGLKRSHIMMTMYQKFMYATNFNVKYSNAHF